jgi:erythronate-4-phosphate dehydrogenase
MVGRNAMLIVADENIPFVERVFSSLGEVRTLPGRAMTASLVRDADLLLVRSVTKVGPDLLEGSRVRFVATATIGFDHIDRRYLEERGIGFTAAPGSNAQSVAQYVTAALLVLEARGVLKLSASTLGIVGVGNVGSRVARLASALGLKTLLNDPPRARAEGASGFVPLETILTQAQVITFHVPLERSGPEPTWHLLDQPLLKRLPGGIVLINSSRGAVHDTGALLGAKRSGKLGALVLDVFEQEPSIDPELVGLADLVTPHIAGYSYDGKIAGTRLIYQAACRACGAEPRWPEGVPPPLDLAYQLARPQVREAVRAAYDIEADDRRLRAVMANQDALERARGFDRLRKEYPARHEFANWRIVLAPSALAAEPCLGRLGFRVVMAGQ